jgi:acetyl esterase/lipase
MRLVRSPSLPKSDQALVRNIMRKANRSPWHATLVVAALVAATPAHAQAVTGPGDIYPLYPAGSLPPSDAPPETSDGGRVRNVSTPTLTVFHPKTASDDGAAIIIAPGGGFEHLSFANEGTTVARRLAAAGITAIVLKYRLALSPAERAGAPNSSPAATRAMADGDAAIKFVRAHAQTLGLSPHRIGFLGFSAGAAIAMHLAVSPDAAARPDFVASIYGVMPKGAVVPAAAPPLFLAVATDDKLVGPAASLAIFEAWHAAGHDVELHVFQAGGHGFGMTAQNTTSDHWIDDYLWWLRQRGLIKSPAIAP